MLHQETIPTNSNNTVQKKEKKAKKKHHLFCHKHTSAKEEQEPVILTTINPPMQPPAPIAEPYKPQPETNAQFIKAQQQIEMLDQMRLNTQQENNTLKLQHQQDAHMIAYLKLLKGKSPVDEMKNLLDHIIAFENDGIAPHKKEFLQSLKRFARLLNKNLITQAANPDLPIEKTTAYTLTNLTTQMLKDLKEDAKNDKIQVLKDFEKACHTTPRWKKFFKAIAVVCIAAVGFVLGAAIGMGVGILAGVWSGPGAFVTAAVGLVTGSVTGAALGVAGGALATGLSAATVSSILFFKPSKLERNGTALGKKGELMFRRQP